MGGHSKKRTLPHGNGRAVREGKERGGGDVTAPKRGLSPPTSKTPLLACLSLFFDNHALFLKTGGVATIERVSPNPVPISPRPNAIPAPKRVPLPLSVYPGWALRVVLTIALSPAHPRPFPLN